LEKHYIFYEKKRGIHLIQELITELDMYYTDYKDIYFHHMKCVLKAQVLLIKHQDYERARLELNDVKESLLSIETCFLMS